MLQSWKWVIGTVRSDFGLSMSSFCLPCTWPLNPAPAFLWNWKTSQWLWHNIWQYSSFCCYSNFSLSPIKEPRSLQPLTKRTWVHDLRDLLIWATSIFGYPKDVWSLWVSSRQWLSVPTEIHHISFKLWNRALQTVFMASVAQVGLYNLSLHLGWSHQKALKIKSVNTFFIRLLKCYSSGKIFLSSTAAALLETTKTNVWK